MVACVDRTDSLEGGKKRYSKQMNVQITALVQRNQVPTFGQRS
jgi:hypothetical protein